ncbi:TIGR02186 family protein [Tepidamorphus sp. 3E244]|uniref:TIGR02186 family protein n=1 Tax=Tepidamorphus sp. 3E244 TaxID=3385498 RepID=UPI0038FCEBD6
MSAFVKCALAALALVATLFASGMNGARAEGLVAALSQETVFIQSNFTGASLTLFGSIERDAATVGRSGTYDLVVVVRGPDAWPVVRRKGQIAGVWLNRDAVRFQGVPTYYAIQSNRPSAEIADEAVLRRYEIGFTNLNFRPAMQVSEEDRLNFASALVRLRLGNGLFSEAPSGVSFLNEQVFSTRIHLPSNISTGPYRIELYLFRDAALLARESLHFGVRKTGFEALVFNLSENNPYLYGIACVLLAIALGWLAGMMFRQS